MAVEVEASDVIKVILQFLTDAGLTDTAASLTRESGVHLNAVPSVAALAADVRRGAWDAVLPLAARLRLPAPLLTDLYELVVLELVELREPDAARALLRSSAVLSSLRAADPARAARLDALTAAPVLDPDAIYGDAPRDARRAGVAAALAAAVVAPPPARLLTLIGDALRHARATGALPPGAAVDLVRGGIATGGAAGGGGADEEEAAPSEFARAIRFGAKSHAEAAAFAPDGASLVTGSVDGFVEVWDVGTGRLRADLQYQADEKFMMHDAPVLAVALSPDGALAASGDRDGHVKVWRLATGALLRALDPPSADGAGVTALAFSPDGGQLAIASYDGVARVAGLKSGRVLRELRGHASFVLAVAYTPDGGTLVTGSADGTLRTWDARTGEAGLAVVPPRAATARAGAPDAPVVAVLPHPTDPGVVVVATRAPCLHIVNVASGAILATLATGKADGGDVVAAALSSRGGFAHALAEDGVLYSFNTGTRLLDGVLTVVEAGADGKLPPPIGVACHPGRNVAATWGADGAVKLWDAGSG